MSMALYNSCAARDAFVRTLTSIRDDEVEEFGRKAMILASMNRHGIQIPDGLCFAHSLLVAPH